MQLGLATLTEPASCLTCATFLVNACRHRRFSRYQCTPDCQQASQRPRYGRQPGLKGRLLIAKMLWH